MRISNKLDVTNELFTRNRMKLPDESWAKLETSLPHVFGGLVRHPDEQIE